MLPIISPNSYTVTAKLTPMLILWTSPRVPTGRHNNQHQWVITP